jgi:xylulokinase
MVEVAIGIDLGTQGARVVAVNPSGALIAAAHQSLAAPAESLPAGWFEQDPLDWWRAVREALRQVVGTLPARSVVSGICVDSTSGTILAVDAQGEPLSPAVMYNDRRSEEQASRVQSAGAAHQARHGYIFGSSYALPKILWFKEARPELFERAARFLHAADFIAGKLSGDFSCSDSSNALKTGYDLLDLRWPDFIERNLGIPLARLPRVTLPGQPIGQVSRQAADETGLLPGTLVLAGATDGTAAQIASGAARPGDWNSTLGTTLVFKGISRELHLDPQGRVYFHRHPEGWWMPGGASNTGTDWIGQDHPGADLEELGRQAAEWVPTRLLRYPLLKQGERFPFIHPQACGFLVGEPCSAVERYAAGLEGVALVERLAYDTLRSIGLEVGEKVYITGGGTRSPEWSRIRASALEKTLLQPAVTETAFGAAVLAASGCWFSSVSQAAAAMVHIAATIEPDLQLAPAYRQRYSEFIVELARRGYLANG